MNQKSNFDLPASRATAASLKGLRITSVYIDVVDREVNVVYLISDDKGFVIDGGWDCEVLRFAKLDAKIAELRSWGLSIVKYRPFEIFVQHRVAEVREMGAPNCGHGWEISFEDLCEKTMIVQSIRGSPKPKGFDNCLRLGLAEYRWEIGNRSAINE